MESLCSDVVLRGLEFEGGVALAERSPGEAPIEEFAEYDPHITGEFLVGFDKMGGFSDNRTFAIGSDG